MIAALIVSTCALSWLLTAAMRRYALSAQLLDVPNARSSHVEPTPRGGGVAIVASALAALTWLLAVGAMPKVLGAAVLGAGGAIAAIGFADDHWKLPARWRLLGHAAAAVWVLWLFGPLPPVPGFGVAVELGGVGLVVAACYLVWAINFFNFMDGIDGIASVEAITVALGGALVSWLALPDANWLTPVLFAAAVLGFLFWNRPPARIFMGDAGSGFLGIMIGTLTLWHGYQQPQLFWAWFVLQGCFMVDATTTLLRRLCRGAKASQAHRSHAYQYAARRHGSHGVVTLACGALTLLWLLPIAAAVALSLIDGLVGVAVAYVPLVLLAYRYRAGAAELQLR